MTDMALQHVRPADESAFRELMSAFPSGVTVVTTRDRDGTPRGLTCTAMCSVSLRPPILLTCVRHDSETLAAMLRRGRFAVNLLHAGGRAAADVFANAVRDRFTEVEWESSPRGDLPWLTADAHAVAECAVAGFVEAGESCEAAVVREVAEEVGVPVTRLRYVGSQAWPYPGSLMLGFMAEGDPNRPLCVDEAEISEARWFTRAEVRDVLEGRRDDFGLPMGSSIAHFLVAEWLAGRV